MKRLAALTLSFVLILSLVACEGLSTDQKNGVTNADEQTREIPWRPGTGDIIELGGYSWKVLSIEDHQALLVSEDVVAVRPYCEAGTSIVWGESSLCQWLNSDFLQNFDDSELVRITRSTLDDDAERTFRVFILSPKELEKYLPEESTRIANLNLTQVEDHGRQGEPYPYWVRFVLKDDGYYPSIQFVDIDGALDYPTSNPGDFDHLLEENGIRPALWLQVE
jgi:hypothetical protein